MLERKSNPAKIRLLAWTAGWSCLALGGGCFLPASDEDFYSRVASACQEPVPRLGELFENADPEFARAYLSPDCRAALESVLPWDDESFENAPRGFKDRITEAFHALLAYPLTVPEDDSLLGVQGLKQGALGLDVVRAYLEGGHPNQAIFNYVLNRFDVIRYAGSGTTGQWAEYNLDLSHEPRVLLVRDSFWSATAARDYRNPFLRASILVHEARHFDGFGHRPCEPGQDSSGDRLCDSEANGPWGMQLAYFHYLLMGNERCPADGCAGGLAKQSIASAGFATCWILKDRILNRAGELDPILDEVDCGKPEDVYHWIVRHEELRRTGTE